MLKVHGCFVSSAPNHLSSTILYILISRCNLMLKTTITPTIPIKVLVSPDVMKNWSPLDQVMAIFTCGLSEITWVVVQLLFNNHWLFYLLGNKSRNPSFDTSVTTAASVLLLLVQTSPLWNSGLHLLSQMNLQEQDPGSL